MHPLVLNIVSLLIVAVVAAFDNKPFAITPENLRFASMRCAEEYGDGNGTLIELWFQSEFPNNHATHCFVKCFLRRLGLIDLHTRGFNQWKFFEALDNIHGSFNPNCLNEFMLHEHLNDRCVSYYDKWMQFRAFCPRFVSYVFLENDNDALMLLPSKALGETATEFCSRSVALSGGSADKQDNPVVYKCNVSCIFWQFHYFDAYGRFDEKEILRSFTEAKSLTNDTKKVVKDCTNRANAKYDGYQSCEMAWSLKNCLQEQTNVFSHVLYWRNSATAQY